MIEVCSEAKVKATGEEGTVTMTNGHAHKVCGKWYLTEELEISVHPAMPKGADEFSKFLFACDRNEQPLIPDGYEEGHGAVGHVNTGVTVYCPPIRIARPTAADMILYHYTGDAGFRGIIRYRGLKHLRASHEERAHLGDGVYATQKAPHEFDSQRSICRNNYTNSTNAAKVTRQVNRWHEKGMAEYCIPIIVPRWMAINVMQQRTKEMPRVGYTVEREGHESEPVRKDRDLWVIIVEDSKSGHVMDASEDMESVYKRLGSHIFSTRLDAVETLAAYAASGNQRATVKLLNSLQDPNHMVRIAAIWAVAGASMLTVQQAVVVMFHLLDEESVSDVIIAAEEALQFLTQSTQHAILETLDIRLNYKRKTHSSPVLERSDAMPPSGEKMMPAVGDIVLAGSKQLRGKLCFHGGVSWAPGDWMGIMLDDPLGNNDGCLRGERYFECKPNHGVFMRPQSVVRALDVSVMGVWYLEPSDTPTIVCTITEHSSCAVKFHSDFFPRPASYYYFDRECLCSDVGDGWFLGCVKDRGHGFDQGWVRLKWVEGHVVLNFRVLPVSEVPDEYTSWGADLIGVPPRTACVISWDQFAAKLAASSTEVCSEIRTAEELLCRVWKIFADAGQPNFTRSELVGSLRKDVALTGTHDLDICLSVDCDLDSFMETRVRFMKQLRSALEMCDDVQLFAKKQQSRVQLAPHSAQEQQEYTPTAHRILLKGWLIIDLIVVCHLGYHDTKVGMDAACHVSASGEDVQLFANKVEEAHLLYIRTYAQELQRKSHTFLPHYPIASVLCILEQPQAVRNCILLLKGWRLSLLDRSSSFHHAAMLKSCILEQLAIHVSGERNCSQSSCAMDLFCAVLQVLKGATPDSPRKLSKCARPIYSEHTFATELAALQVASQNPLLIWNPFNPFDDMMGCFQKEHWAFVSEEASKALELLCPSPEVPSQFAFPQKIFGKAVLDLATFCFAGGVPSEGPLCILDQLVMECSPIELKSDPVIVISRPSGAECKVEILPDTKVYDLKQAIHRSFQIPVPFQRLSLKGSILSDASLVYPMLQGACSLGLLLVQKVEAICPDCHSKCDIPEHKAWFHCSSCRKEFCPQCGKAVYKGTTDEDNWYEEGTVSCQSCGFEKQWGEGKAGCFDAKALIQMADGTKKVATELAKGDKVAIGGTEESAKVLCIILNHCPGKTAGQLMEVGPLSLMITRKHPVRILGRWCAPMDVGTPTKRTCEAICSLLLDKGHVVEANGVMVACLAHGFEEESVCHHYYGTAAVVDDLRRLPGFDDGRIEMGNPGARRISGAGLIESFNSCLSETQPRMLEV